MYKELLASAPSAPLRGAAIAGLGRYGDASVVDAIVAAAKEGGPELQDVAVSSLEMIEGRAAAGRIRDAYPTFEAEARLKLVAMFGRRGDAAYLAVLREEAKSDSAAFRMAALKALSSSTSA